MSTSDPFFERFFDIFVPNTGRLEPPKSLKKLIRFIPFKRSRPFRVRVRLGVLVCLTLAPFWPQNGCQIDKKGDKQNHQTFNRFFNRFFSDFGSILEPILAPFGPLWPLKLEWRNCGWPLFSPTLEKTSKKSPNDPPKASKMTPKAPKMTTIKLPKCPPKVEK